MNKINIQHAINIMQRVIDRHSRFNMRRWRGGLSTAIHTEETLHECGMPACLGGWIGVSPEFIKDGGYVSTGGLPGIPGIRGYSGEDAIAEWLDISLRTAERLCCTHESLAHYQVHDEEVTPQMVIEKLKGFL